MKIRSVVAAVAAAAVASVGSATVAHAAPVSSVVPRHNTGGPLLPGAPGFDEKLDRALNTLNLEIGAGSPITGMLGTAVGAGIGCLVGLPAGSVVSVVTSTEFVMPEEDAVGCLGGAAIGAAIGGVAAQAPVLLGASGQFLKAMLAPDASRRP